jgi:hypothetical protein
MQTALRNVREATPYGPLRNVARQSNFCIELLNEIAVAEAAASLLCAISIIEPTPFAEAACAAALAYVFYNQSLYWLWCGG